MDSKRASFLPYWLFVFKTSKDHTTLPVHERQAKMMKDKRHAATFSNAIIHTSRYTSAHTVYHTFITADSRIRVVLQADFSV